MPETPIAWRVWWIQASNKPFDPMYKRKRFHKDFATLAEAEIEKKSLTVLLDDENTAVCIESQYISRRKRDAKFKEGQDNLGMAGWPLQMRPPR